MNALVMEPRPSGALLLTSYYEQAFDLYSRAATFSESPDAWYNACVAADSARVKYVLGSEFYEPPAAQSGLVESVALYASALDRSDVPQPGDIPSAVRLDIVANLAYALQSLGELVEEFGWVSIQPIALTLPGICSGQLESPEALYAAAAMLFGETAQGQLSVLSSAVGNAPSSGGDSRQAPVEDASDAYTSSLVAPSSYLEMLAEQLSSIISVLSRSTAESVAVATQSGRDVLAHASAYITSLEPGFGASQSPDGEWDARVTDLHWSSISLQVGAATRIAELGGTDPALDELCSMVIAAGDALLAEAPPRESLTGVRMSGAEGSALARQTAAYEATVERLSETADYAHALARALLRNVASNGCAAALERAWELCGFASRCMLAAVAPLEPAGKGASTARVSAAQALSVAGAPMAWIRVDNVARRPGACNASTKVSRTRASMYAELSSLALTRCDSLFSEFADNARRKLLDNARIYARRALVDHGLEWVPHIKGAAPSDDGLVVYGRALAHAPADGGWESLSNEADILLGCVRAVYLRGIYIGDMSELDALAGAAWSLVQQGGSWALALGPLGTERWVEALGSQADESERAFWLGAWAALMTSPTCYPYRSSY